MCSSDLLVNKADGALLETARRTCADYAGALRLLRRRPQDPEGMPKAMTVSAADGDGIAGAWAEIAALADWRRAAGHFAAHRAEQARSWFEDEVRAALIARLSQDARVRAEMERLGRAVEGGLSPSEAARRMAALLATGQGPG